MMIDTAMMYFGYTVAIICLSTPVFMIGLLIWVHLSISFAYSYAVSKSGASDNYSNRHLSAFFKLAMMPKLTFSYWGSTIKDPQYYRLDCTGFVPKVTLHKRAQEAGDEN